MEFLQKIREKQNDFAGKRQPTVAFLGDSVTHGCFDLFVQNEAIQTEMELDKAYHEKFRSILNTFYPSVPITVINAGISGDKAIGGIARLERDVLSFRPDLVVVCFGLNDSGQEEGGLEQYVSSLKGIFDAVRESGAETIFLTPNLKTDHVDVKYREKILDDCLEICARNERAGWLERYLNEARALCEREAIPVCDCNKIWKTLRENDADINHLLANRVNHPIERMHWMFAYELVRTIFTC